MAKLVGTGKEEKGKNIEWHKDYKITTNKYTYKWTEDVFIILFVIVTTPCVPADIAVAMRGLQATVGMTSVMMDWLSTPGEGVEYKGPVDTCLPLSLQLTMSAYRRQTPRHVAFELWIVWTE